MDRFLIKQSTSSEKSSEEPPAKKHKKDYDKKYDTSKRKRTFQDTWLSEFPWMRVDDDGTAKCTICRQFPSNADTKCGLYTGMKVTRKDTLQTHEKSSKHMSCQLKSDREKLKKTHTVFTGALDKTVFKYNKGQSERFKLLFNTAFAVAKNRKPFTDYELMCEVQKKNGLDLGNDHLNRKACTEFVSSIAGSLQDSLKTKLQEAKFYSIMSDSSTDSAIVDQESILVRFVDPDTKEPTTSLASIEPLETPDSNGVFLAIKRGLTTIDIDLDNPDSSSALVCVNMDGASVNMGAKNGVARKLSDCVSHPVIVTHCVAHRLELGVLDAAKKLQYLEHFEQTIKRIYKFYSFSPKRRSHLQAIAEILDQELVMYSDIKSIRWVSSKQRAVKAVVQDYEATVTHLEQILETSKKTDEKAQAKKILHDITQVKFVKYMHLMVDILRHVCSVSQLFQVSDLLIFEVQEAVDTLYTKLHAMTGTPGPSLQEFYNTFDADTRLYKGVKLNGLLPKSYDEDREVNAFMSNITQDILNRFSNLSEAPIVYFKVFDFRVWPNSLNELSVYGNDGIVSLCEHYKDLLTDEDQTRIPDEWQQLKVRLSKQKGAHPLAALSQILQLSEKTFTHISTLIELLLTISPSTAACERSFSSMNLIKTPSRSTLSQANLKNQMRIVLSGPSLQDFDASDSVMHWLENCKGGRHLTHKPRVSQTQQSGAPTTSSTEQQAAENDTQLVVTID